MIKKYPNRIVEVTSRTIELRRAIANYFLEDSEWFQKIWDIVIYGASGRVHGMPDQAADVVPVVKHRGIARLKNCIVLGRARASGQLAVAGGFNSTGEAMSETAIRELIEEMLSKYSDSSMLSRFVFIGERSSPPRDDRPIVVISTLMACQIDFIGTQISGTDDMDDIFVVPLITNDGDLNDSFFEAGTYTCAWSGKQFTHYGLRGDHELLLLMLYKYWKQYGEPLNLDLSQTIYRMSQTTPQLWFKFTPEVPFYNRIERQYGRTLYMTENTAYALNEVAKVFIEGGYGENHARRSAFNFVADMVEKNVLPLFPQSSAAVDLIIVLPGDRLLVVETPDGLALPGSFYSAEKKDGFLSILGYAKHIAWTKLGVEFHPRKFMGTVGGLVATGKPSDTRYPRLSYVYLGYLTKWLGVKQLLGNLPDGWIAREIDIWNDKVDCPSDAILNGINGKSWLYQHNLEILLPLLYPYLEVVNPKRKYSVIGLLRRIVDSFQP